MQARVARGIDTKKIAVYLIITLLSLVIVTIPAFYIKQYLGVISTLNTTILLLITTQFYICVLFGLRRRSKYPESIEWPKVSIVIPAYNEESVLPRSIETMLAIDYPEDLIEFIYVYEAKGTDRTKDILIEESAKDKRIRPVLRDERSGGKAAATNYGIRHSRGSIVACYDADHSLAVDSVKNAVRTLLSDPKVMCVKGRYRTINKDEGLLAKVSGIERDISDSLIWYGHDVLGGFTCMGGNAFFKKKIFDELGYFHENTLTEDVDYSLRIHEAGYELRINPDVVSWEESPASMTQWWHQRKRWARGWIQSSIIHVKLILKSPRVSLIKKIDTINMLSITLIQPVMLLFYPSNIFVTYGISIFNYYPPWLIALTGGLLSVSSILAASIVWVRDYRKGERFRWDEIILLPVVAIYLSLQTLVAWVGFIEEFILKSKYEFVKTDRSGAVTLPPPSPSDEPSSS